jgi:NTP pyrophosphatase (non-canonical NTP hydrolase)
MDNFMQEKGKHFAGMKGNTTQLQLVKVMFEIAELAEAVEKGYHDEIINEGFDVMQSVMTLIMTVDKDLIPGSLDMYYDDWKKKIEGYISEGGKYNNK